MSARAAMPGDRARRAFSATLVALLLAPSVVSAQGPAMPGAMPAQGQGMGMGAAAGMTNGPLADYFPRGTANAPNQNVPDLGGTTTRRTYLGVGGLGYGVGGGTAAGGTVAASASGTSRASGASRATASNSTTSAPSTRRTLPGVGASTPSVNLANPGGLRAANTTRSFGAARTRDSVPSPRMAYGTNPGAGRLPSFASPPTASGATFAPARVSGSNRAMNANVPAAARGATTGNRNLARTNVRPGVMVNGGTSGQGRGR